MAEALKFSTLDKALEVYPELPWKASDDTVWIWDDKADEYVVVTKGDYVVHIGTRYEVTDTEPEKAKPAQAPVEEEKK